MSKMRILYVANEINPFLTISKAADFVLKIAQDMQDRGFEIRILVPKFGNINERKNRLHEVVRLSGINISIEDEDKPLIIKVASVPQARLQVYFLDNEDYFQRKYVFEDKDGNFYDDNAQRAIFFCKGAIETVRKLGWVPNVVHCVDWMSSLVPLYLKTTYASDPMFEGVKTVFSIFDQRFHHKFTHDIVSIAKDTGIPAEALASLGTNNYDGFVALGIEYADVVVTSDSNLGEAIDSKLNEFSQKRLEINPENEPFKELFFEIYNK